jgi:hypothetical protein
MMENFWSLLKRGLHGTYISVEPFHLFRYLDEQAFRYNSRIEIEMTDSDRSSLVCSRIAGRRPEPHRVVSVRGGASDSLWSLLELSYGVLT